MFCCSQTGENHKSPDTTVCNFSSLYFCLTLWVWGGEYQYVLAQGVVIGLFLGVEGVGVGGVRHRAKVKIYTKKIKETLRNIAKARPKLRHCQKGEVCFS